MKKRLFGTLLMGAMFIASMSMFTSCKDYDDDINSNKDAITELQKTAADLQSKLQNLENKHNEDIGKLNSAIQALQNEAATHATKKELQDAVSALEKSIADLTQIAATKEALNAVNEALEAKKADKTALEELQKTLAAADAAIQLDIEGIKKVDNDQNIAIAAAQKQLKDQQDAIDELKRALEGKASVEDLNKLAKTVGDNSTAIAAIQKKLDGIENVKKYIDDADAKLKNDLQKYATDADSKLKDELVKLMNEADNKVRTDIGKDIATLTLYIDQILNSIVLRPTNYVDGIEAIDVPMLLYQDILYFSGKEADMEKNAEKIARGGVTLDNETGYYVGDTWIAEAGKNQGTPQDIHWINGFAGLIPNITYIWNERYTGNAYNVLDPGISAITGNKYIHILPAEGTEFDQYDAYETYQAHVLYNVNPSSPDLDGATFSFDVNTADVTLATPSTKAMGDDAMIYPVNADASTYKINGGVMDVPFRVNLSEYLNFYAKSFAKFALDYQGTTADGQIEQYLHLNEQTLQMPFAAATITKAGKSGIERSVNSDWGLITPRFMQLIALADNDPDTKIAQAWGKLDRNEVTQNHLYETPTQAILGQATHEVVYDGELDLKPFVETHAACFGTYFSRDKALTDEILEEMGLEYRYEFVDYADNRYKTQQSKHADPDKIKDGIVDPCGVTATDGEPDATQPVAYASIGREPLVRVRLVHINQTSGKEQTLLVGYIKVRIVKEASTQNYAEVNIADDVYMNCPGIAEMKWYEVENYIYEATGLSKAEFDNQYELEMNANYYQGAVRYAEVGAGNYVNEADYVKLIGDQYLNSNMTIEKLIESNMEFATNYYAAFAGIVGYTSDRWQSASWYNAHYSDPKQTQSNIVFWALGVANSANAHAFMDGTYTDAKVDMYYIRHLVQPDANGNSTKDLSTIVRFVKKTDKTASLYLKLTIPAGKLHWPTATLANKRPAYWYELNSNTKISTSSDMTKVQEIHVNVPQPRYSPANPTYTSLNHDNYVTNLLDNFIDLTPKFTVADVDNFTYFASINGDNGETAAEKLANLRSANLSSRFYFTSPSNEKGNADFDAVEVNYKNPVTNSTMKALTWTVEGYSGRHYTLAVANVGIKDGKYQLVTEEKIDTIDVLELGEEYKNLLEDVVALDRGSYIVAIAEEDINTGEMVTIAPQVVVALNDNQGYETSSYYQPYYEYLNRQYDGVRNEFMKFYPNALAEDILNYAGRDASKHEEFQKNKIFTAYMKLEYAGCYGILLDRTTNNFFNARFERPVNFYPLGISAVTDADNNAVINPSQFIYKWGNTKKVGNTQYKGITNTAFTDWRGYAIIPSAFCDDNLTLATPYEKAEYYDIAIDGAPGSKKLLSGGYWTSAIDNTGTGTPWAVNANILKEIRTDYDVLDRSKAYDGTTAAGHKAISALPVASIKYGGSIDLQINTNGDLQYHNNAGNVSEFHLYVPLYWSYQFGDEYNTYNYNYFRSRPSWGVVTIKTTMGY